MPILPIPRTLQLVTNCWLQEESAIRNVIPIAHPDADEEFITKMFHGRFAQTLKAASNNGSIEKAFLLDLTASFPELASGYDLTEVSHGIIADVALHPREKERFTGGDIGLVISRPQVDYSHEHVSYFTEQRPSVTLRRSYHNFGLLVQAKLNKKDSWGTFTDTQKKVLPKRLSYLSLLLYRYGAKPQQSLFPFQWQLCKIMSFKQVENCLKNDNFPSLATSDRVLLALGNGTIGTSERSTLDQVICLAGRTSLVVNIHWRPPPPGGSPLQSLVQVVSKHVSQSHSQSDYQYQHHEQHTPQKTHG